MIASRHLSETITELHSCIAHSIHGEKVTSALLITLLDVSNEGMMQQEIRDIIDELDMMLNIIRQQEDAVKKFNELAQSIFDDSPSERKAWRSAFEQRSGRLATEISRGLREVEDLKRSADSTSKNASSAAPGQVPRSERGLTADS